MNVPQLCFCIARVYNKNVSQLRSVYTQRDRDRERERGFSSWNSLVICRRTVQTECEREQFFVRANDRLDCPQSEFCQTFARLFLLFTYQQVLLLHYFYK